MKKTVQKKKSKYDIDELVQKMEEYTQSTDIPILKEFCFINNLSYQYVANLRQKLENADLDKMASDKESDDILEENKLSYSIRRLLMKKEFMLEKKALKNEIPINFAVFSLKQLGWRDGQDIEVSTSESSAPSFKISIVKAED